VSSLGFSVGGSGSTGFTIGGGGGSSVVGPAVKKGPSFFGQLAHDVVAVPEHLLSDVGNAAVNFFPGMYDLGKTALLKPQDLPKYASAVVKQYEDYYGHDVLNHIYQHPLQPLLDGLTLVSGGLGAAAKVGEIGDIASLARLGERASLITRSPEAIRTGIGPTIERLSSDKPIVKLRQLATQRVRQSLDEFARSRSRTGQFGPIGQLETRAYGKALGHQAIQQALADAHPIRPYEKAWRKLSTNEKIALSARSMDIHPTNLKEFWQGTKNGEELTPEVQALMLKPSEKMLAAEGQARMLSDTGAGYLKRQGSLSVESELDRPGRFKDQVAAFLGHPIEDIHGDPYYLPHTTESTFRRGSHPMDQVGGGKAEPRLPGSTKRNLGTLFSQGKLDLANDVLGPEFLRRVKWLKFWGIHQGLKNGAVRMTWDELHAMHPSGMAPAGYDFLRTSTVVHDSDRVRVLLRKAEQTNRRRPNFDNAQRVQDLERELHLYQSGAKADRAKIGKQRLPFSIRGEGTHPMRGYADMIRDPEDLHDSALSEGFTTKDIAHAATDEAGRYFLVPKAMSKAATGEFTRMSTPLYWMTRYPLKFWRSLLLGARPAFLVNNLVGNGLMYGMKIGGKGAIRDLLMAMRESGVPDQTLHKLIDDHSTPADMREALHAELATTPHGLTEARPEANIARREGPIPVTGSRLATPYTPDFYRQFFPEQMSGTMGLTQSPSTEGLLRGATSKAGQGFQKATGALPSFTSKVAEEGFRRGLIRNFIRNSPEFKATYRQMPADTRTFTSAARKLLTGQGGAEYQRLISEQVDRSLGNYTHLNPIERNVMRNIFPFYAWYRAILSTTIHLGLDNPLRAQFLYRLGAIGAETAASQAGVLPLPSYLQGAIPLGAGPGGTQRVFATQSINPWGTLQQLGRGTTTDLSSLGLNPFIQGALDSFKKLSSAPGGTTKAVTLQALVTTMLSSTIKGLPPMSLIEPAGKSKLYPNRNLGTALEAWAGAPIKEVNPVIAAQYAAAGQ